MNDDRRRRRRQLEPDEPAVWEPAVDSLLENVAAADLRQLTRVGSRPTAACPSLTRHRRAALRHDWAPEEVAHLQTCRRCARTQQTVASAVWHPEVRMLARRLAGRLDDADAQVLAAHLYDDGCRSCPRLLGSPWLRDLADRMERSDGGRRPGGAECGALAVGCLDLPRAVGEFATGTRPPFQLRAVASEGNLVVTLRETDQGQLVVHVEAPHAEEAGQTVVVELLGDGEPLVAEVVLQAVDGEPGCIGRHTFGPFVDIVPRLRPAVALLAVLAEKRRCE